MKKIKIKKFKKGLDNGYRSVVGLLVVKEYRKKNIGIEIEKKNNENIYPVSFLEEYFSNNPIPEYSENCEPITVEMIKVLPIKTYRMLCKSGNYTTDGTSVFNGEKQYIGYWIN